MIIITHLCDKIKQFGKVTVLCQPKVWLWRCIYMKLVFVTLAMFSFGVCAQVPEAASTPVRSAATKPHSRLPVKRSQKVLARAAIKPGEMDDTDTDSDDINAYVGYRRPKVIDSPQVADPELSDYIKTRLLVARARALQKYQETWS